MGDASELTADLQKHRDLHPWGPVGKKGCEDR